MNDERESWGERYITWVAFSVVLAVFGIYLTVLLCAIWPIDTYTVAQSGVFGDSFGLLTSLFSGLAFAGLLVAISYQRRDLGLTKTELRETRIEIQKQHRENNVFQLLRILNDVVAQLDVKQRDEEGGQITDISTGRDCFDRYHSKLKRRYKELGTKQPGLTPTEKLQAAYQSFWRNWRKDLGHYFRTLFNIFEYLRREKFSAEDKMFYGDIVRAQLSDPELAVLFHHCLTDEGGSFRALAEEFSLFENLPAELVLDCDFLNKVELNACDKNRAMPDQNKNEGLA